MCKQSPSAPPRHPFGLGEWRVDPTLDRISRGNEIVKMAPRVMQVLLCLADHDGQVVSKRRLIHTVWDQEFVTEGALTRCIAILRKSLGDDASRPRYVENVPRRGYRLLMPNQPLSDPGTACQDRPYLCWLSHGERRFVLSEGENLIGRASDAEVHIDSKRVSRHHARILVTGGQATVEDLGSKNGTFLERRRLDTVCELHDGDQVGIGSVSLVFRVDDPRGTTETGHSR